MGWGWKLETVSGSLIIPEKSSCLILTDLHQKNRSLLRTAVSSGILVT